MSDHPLKGKRPSEIAALGGCGPEAVRALQDLEHDEDVLEALLDVVRPLLTVRRAEAPAIRKTLRRAQAVLEGWRD